MTVFLFRRLAMIVVFALCGFAGWTWAQGRAPDLARLGLQESPVPGMQTKTGTYLAARFAQRHQDWDAAAVYMEAVEAAGLSPSPAFSQNIFLISLGAGDYERAAARVESTLTQRSQDEAARLFLAAQALAAGDFAGARTQTAALPQGGAAGYLRPLIEAWSFAGEGRGEEAFKTLSTAAEAKENLRGDAASLSLHSGLIAEFLGDRKRAADAFDTAIAAGLSLNGAMIAVEAFRRAQDEETASRILAALDETYPLNAYIGAMKIPGRKAAPAPNVRAGAAIALYEVAGVLYEKKSYDGAAIYLSLARFLSGETPPTSAMAADIAALRGQHARALRLYNAVAADSPLYGLTRLRMAEVLDLAGHGGAALRLLRHVAGGDHVPVQASATMGDLLMAKSEFRRAHAAYDAAIRKAGREHPGLVYARGLAAERMNDWPSAERDLKRALDLQPDNPQILNALGYAWIDRGLNLTQALDMIARAADMRPDDGYILDSYGWAFYRLGRYDEAAEWLARAAALTPEDATIQGHLGDALWRLGRADEARFAWRHAQRLSVDPAERAQLDAKIQDGMPSLPVTGQAAQK